MTIPERIIALGKAVYLECEQMDSYGIIETIARAILAAEQRGAASSQQATATDEQAVDMWLSEPEGFSLRIERLYDDVANDPGRMRDWLIAAYRLGREAASSQQAEPVAETFQQGVDRWLIACFGEEIARDKVERNHRFIEEALELAQAGGCTAGEAHQLVDYVFNRPVGDIWQEVGGVMNTLAALCLAHDLDMMDCGEREIARCWTKVEKIRAKQAAKPKHSPLPGYASPSPASDSTLVAALEEAERILWLISGRSSTDRLCRENGLPTGPSQILARTWLEKYSSRIGPGALQSTDQKGDGHE